MSNEQNQKHFSVLGFQFSIEVKKYLPLLFQVWLLLAAVLLVSVLFFSYKMTSADIPGGLVSGALLAYLIHIIKDF